MAGEPVRSRRGAVAAPGIRTSTVPERLDRAVPRRERLLRSSSAAIVAVIVGCAALGLLGTRTGVAVATGNGYVLEVAYARINRPGLAHELSFVVSSGDGRPLPPEVELRVDAHYLALLDDNGMEPLPVRSFNTGRWTTWTFSVPPGESKLGIDLDSRLEPGAQWGAQGSAALLRNGREVVSVQFTTWVLP